MPRTAPAASIAPAWAPPEPAASAVGSATVSVALASVSLASLDHVAADARYN
jgi:hypothetical protein